MAGERDLLVASAGGHLTQLWLLADRLPDPRPRTFVTYDHVHSASLLGGEEVVHGHGPSSRSATKTFANWRLARQMLATGRYGRVVSTGSAIAVPFLLSAASRGIEARYIESATRSAGPSLTGRLLSVASRRVQLYTQHPQWADDRWRAVPSVFAGFSATPGRPVGGPLRIVVSLGTHRFPFDRLLRGLAGALRPDDQVLVQHGATPPVPLPGDVRYVPSLPVDELDAELRAADVVVAHAGTGIALSSLAAGSAPVLVPRRGHAGEHVDDHQADTAAQISGRGLGFSAEADELDRGVLERAAALTVRRSCDESTLELWAV